MGSFSQAISSLHAKGHFLPLKKYLESGRPYLGICIGMQVLFAGSDEGEPIPGLGLIDAQVELFKDVKDMQTGHLKAVPHMGWNEATPFPTASSSAAPPQLIKKEGTENEEEDLYFVHSYAVPYKANAELSSWTNTTTQYGDQTFISSVRRGNVVATQFHPEKSGQAGLKVLQRWLEAPIDELSGSFDDETAEVVEIPLKQVDGFTKRIVACLDVRANDAGESHVGTARLGCKKTRTPQLKHLPSPFLTRRSRCHQGGPVRRSREGTACD